MDHSVSGYLKRQSSDRLLAIRQEYAGNDDEYSISIYNIVNDILRQRGMDPDAAAGTPDKV